MDSRSTRNYAGATPLMPSSAKSGLYTSHTCGRVVFFSPASRRRQFGFSSRFSSGMDSANFSFLRRPHFNAAIGGSGFDGFGDHH
jgi:hypothetical protein